MQTEIESLFDNPPSAYTAEHRALFDAFLAELNAGKVRSAEPDAGSPTGWKVNAWVKKGILCGFRMGGLVAFDVPGQPFFDKDTYPLKPLTVEDRVRVVPGGSSIRTGSYVAPSVTCMPPMYVNVGAYVDEGTMIDSHALVGSCAQIGRRVHLSAAAQIGGVLEPIGALPVIIEDDVLVGGNCGVYEGTVVKRGAVLGTGTILNQSTPVYDLVNETVISAKEGPLVIPENAVVVAGSRAIQRGIGKDWGLSLYTPVIVKYKDEKTAGKIQLEDLLR
ncbi:MAG: 2,3,4,5-tetrahydropyridine-2,6-dicarboxylate N-succinyltransferase [Fimbriimonadaceae bacterium]|nr:2,3,4,5-tetrahydropyridine-2,6-dicarboxylate N-succinyltransferase [Fimbriimonadaceae bacterium]